MTAEEYLNNIGIDKGYLSEPINMDDLMRWMEQYANEQKRKEAILFGKYLANTVNTETWDVEDVEERVPELWNDYLKFCGYDQFINTK